MVSYNDSDFGESPSREYGGNRRHGGCFATADVLGEGMPHPATE